MSSARFSLSTRSFSCAATEFRGERGGIDLGSGGTRKTREERAGSMSRREVRYWALPDRRSASGWWRGDNEEAKDESEDMNGGAAASGGADEMEDDIALYHVSFSVT